MRKTIIIHVGRKAPKGYEELPGSIHLGKGLWIMRIRRKPRSEKATSQGGSLSLPEH